MRVPSILKKNLHCYPYHFCNYYHSIIIIAVATENDDEISKNFLGCAKFKDTLKHINCMKVFTIPSWMPRSKNPNIPLNLSPPS